MWVAAGLVLATLIVPTNAGAIHIVRFAPSVGYAQGGPHNVTYHVNLTDTPSFDPRFLTVAEGATVTLDLHNNGSYSHSFTLSSVANRTLNSSWTPAQLDANFSAHPPQTGANITLAPGGMATVNLTYGASYAGDSFEFVSLVPYQFQDGMWGFLNVSLNSPPYYLSENTTNTPAFVPDVLSVTPHAYPAVLNVTVTNVGDFMHTFTVASQTNVTVPQSFGAYFVQYPFLTNTTVPAGPPLVAIANFSVPAPGIYMYICEASGHYAAGMYGYLYVGVPTPPVAPTPSTAVVDTWILVGSLLLVGIGAILAVAATYSGRWPRSHGKHGGHS